MLRFFVAVIFILFVVSCKDASIFSRYQSVDNAQWHKDSIIHFEFSPVDTLSRHNLYINLRNNKAYEFSNLFLIVGIDFPSNTNIIDTLEYEMTDAQGRFLGSGLTDLKENKLEYKTNVLFPTSGTYTVKVQQAMRKSGAIDGIAVLNGITDVGLSIEKSGSND